MREHMDRYHPMQHYCRTDGHVPRRQARLAAPAL